MVRSLLLLGQFDDYQNCLRYAENGDKAVQCGQRDLYLYLMGTSGEVRKYFFHMTNSAGDFPKLVAKSSSIFMAFSGFFL